MKIIITLAEFSEKTGMSDEVCEIVGLNPWCLDEGLATGEDTIELTEEQAKKLGFVAD